MAITLAAFALSMKVLPEIVMFELELVIEEPSAPNTIGRAAVALARSMPVPKLTRMSPELAKK